MSEQIRTVELNSDGIEHGSITKQQMEDEYLGQDLSRLVSDASVQAAKDFLWNNIDRHNRALLLYMTSDELLSKSELEVKHISLAYQYNRL